MTIAQPAVGAPAPSVSLSTTEQLRAAILAGEFLPGERLLEMRLAERLGVSRTPIRAALQALAADGLLDYAPNRGYAVRAFETAEILQAYEIRAVLEGLAAKRAAQLGLDDAARRTIEDALAAGDLLLARGHVMPEDRIAYGASNAAIHGAILAAAGARMLGDLLRLTQQVAPSSHRNVVAFEYHDVRRRHDDHHRIYEAILGRDAARAELLMRGHVESVRLAMTRSAGWTGMERGDG